MAQMAYDLRAFEQKEPRPAPRMRVVRPNPKELARRRRAAFARVRTVVFMAVLVALALSVLVSRAQLTELSAKVNTQQQALVALKSESDYLNHALNAQATTGKVDQYATGELKMVKRQPGQVEYIFLSSENKAQVANRTPLWMERLKNTFLSAIRSLSE